MKLNKGQQDALEVIETRQNVLITGQGGVGKSELIKHIRTLFEGRGKVIHITALTGIAALNIKGSTLHRWAGVGLGEGKPDDVLKKVRRHPKGKANWLNTAILIIDEVSMLSPELFVKLDYIGRNIRRSDRPFGGIQLIFCGDFCQLGPVKVDAYCFESPLWQVCQFQVCHLKENMRQSDAMFQKMLSEIRMGYASPETKEILRSRIGAKVGTDEIQPTRLYSNRASVDEINMKELKKLPTLDNPTQLFTAFDDVSPGEYTEDQRENYIGMLEKCCQAKKKLYLKVGAQVMLIHNLDPDAGLVNGSRGVITEFELINEEEKRPIVKFLNGIERIITHVLWDFEISDDLVVSRFQIPLILGFSATIHKSQSLTIDCVEVDLGDTVFAPGQFYTALSRVRSLEGLSITQINFDKMICDPKVREFYEKLENCDA
jgi:ATP-dependent DNA helicase PIF1